MACGWLCFPPPESSITAVAGFCPGRNPPFADYVLCMQQASSDNGLVACSVPAADRARISRGSGVESEIVVTIDQEVNSDREYKTVFLRISAN